MPAATESEAPEIRRPRGRVSPRALLLLAVIALGVYGLDQLAKYLVVAHLTEGVTVPVLGVVLQFHFVTNSGAAFSFANGFTWIFSIIAVGVVIFIIWFARRIHSLGWAAMFGLVLGGAFGNLTDRLFRPPGFGVGHVVDFIQIWGFPAIFNVADVAITFSMALFIILSLRGVGLDGSTAVFRKPTPPASEGADDAAEEPAPAAKK